MPVVEIDETELLQNRQLRAMVEALGKNPRTARKFAELVKEHNPNAKIDVPPPDPLEERLTKFEQSMNDRLKSWDEEKATTERNQKIAQITKRRDDGFAELRTQRWTDDGLKKVEELMEREGILDPLVAAAYIEKSNPLPEPVTPNSTGSWNFLETPAVDADANIKALLETRGDSEQIADRMVREALTEFRGHQPRR